MAMLINLGARIMVVHLALMLQVAIDTSLPFLRVRMSSSLNTVRISRILQFETDELIA